MFKRMRTAWVRLVMRRSTAEAAITSLGLHSDELHREAMVEPDKARSQHLRVQADHYAEHQSHLKDSLYRPEEVAREALEAGLKDEETGK
jgi:hypothetical protein